MLDWKKVLRRLKDAKVVCIDVETSGLSWQHNFICGYSIGFGPNIQDTVYVPIRHKECGNISAAPGPQTATGWDGSLHPFETELVKLLERQDLLIFGHNLAFDVRFLWRVGLTKHDAHYEDTIINQPLINEHTPKFSLEALCNEWKVEAKKSVEITAHIRKRFPEVTDRNAMSRYWELAGDDIVAQNYARGDAVSTWQLRDVQMKELEAQDLMKVHSVESRLIPVLARMTCTGIKVDEERLHWVKDHIETTVERLVAKFPKDFNVRSPLDVQKWCQDHGETDWPMTPGRVINQKEVQNGAREIRKPQPSFPEIWLKTHAAGQQIVQVRKLETLKSSFIQPMIETHLWNGRVHPNMNQLRGDEYGTVTGRLSEDSPNLQQASKHDYEMGKLHRSIFVADEGKIWGSADWSQIEPRLLAWYAQCRVLLDGYNSNPPVDAHTAVSAAMNKRWPSMSDTERKQYRDAIGKRINQTLITGGGKNTIIKKYGVPADEMDEAWNAYFRAMPEIRTLQKRSAHVFQQRGYVLSLLGRRARLNDDRAYTSVNRLLQCGNADAIKAKLVEIDDYLKSEGRPIDVLNSVHDSIDFQFDEGHRKVYNECLRIMTDFSPGQLIELDVPMVVDAGEGKSWAEATWGGKTEPQDARPGA